VEKNSDYLIIIPAYNEAAHVKSTVNTFTNLKSFWSGSRVLRTFADLFVNLLS